MIFPHELPDDERLDLVINQLCRQFGYFQTLGAPTEGFHVSTAEADILNDLFPSDSDHLVNRLMTLVRRPESLFEFLEELFYEEEEADIILNYILEHFLLPIHYAMGSHPQSQLMRLIIWIYEAIVDFTLDYCETRPLPDIDLHAWMDEVVPTAMQIILGLANDAFDHPLDLTSYEEDCQKIYQVMIDDPSTDIQTVPGLNHVYKKEVFEDSLYDVLLTDTTNVLLRLDISSGTSDVLIWTFKHQV